MELTQYIKYANIRSNHNTNSIKHITKGIESKLPRKSSSKIVFEDKK